jgi:Xaa-Pro aminopeptidase
MIVRMVMRMGCARLDVRTVFRGHGCAHEYGHGCGHGFCARMDVHIVDYRQSYQQGMHLTARMFVGRGCALKR